MQLRSRSTRTLARGLVIGAVALAFGLADVTPAKADPPPWAPAWGWRAKQGHGHGHKFKGKSKHSTVVVQQAPTPVLPPFDIGLGRCNRETLAGLLGAAGGGFLGSKIGDGRGQLAAVAGGTLLGYLIGGSIGRSMDAVDHHCVGQAMEHAQDGQTIAWNNPSNGGQYQVVPTQTIDRGDGRYCREYTAEAMVGGQVQQTYGIACRQPDGSWELQG